MMRTIRETVIAGGIACALGGAQALGAVLYTQNFENLTPGGLDGQDGFTAMAQAQIGDGGLAYANEDVVIAGGARSLAFTGLSPANNWVFSREFEAQSGPVYFALAMTWTEQVNDDMLFFALSNDADSSPVALGNSAGVHINLNGTQTAGLINGRIRGNTTSETTATSSGKAGGKNTASPQFIVGCIDKESSTNYNRLRLWVNPTSYREGASDVTITRDIGIDSGLDTFYFFSGSGNDAGEENRVDNIRIGTTWADVMPSLRGTVIVVK